MDFPSYVLLFVNFIVKVIKNHIRLPRMLVESPLVQISKTLFNTVLGNLL